ncbi:ABC transporter permease [Tengunoibacter tsumagoiensis]|nr:FtsX-like permease family protein [Tengunoibacter tsumagoiensis]
MHATTRKALTDVTRRKGRSLLVILGILIGVLGLTAVNVASTVLGAAFSYSNDQSKSPDIQLFVQSIDQKQADSIAQMENVDQVQLATIYQTRWQIHSASGHTQMQIIAYPSLEQMRFNPFQLTSGHLPGPGEIVLESGDNSIQATRLGETITVTTPNGVAHLRVSGFVRTPGTLSVSLGGRVGAYMTSAALQELSGLSAANVVQVKVHHVQQRDETARQIQATLRAQHSIIFAVSIGQSTQSQSIITGLLSIMATIAIVAIVLTSFLIINTVSMLIAEQTRIIGSMKAVGGTSGKIMRGYLLSVSIYGGVGTVLGIGLGLLLGYLLANYMATIILLDLGPFQFPATAIIISLLVGMGVPWLAAILPLWTGTRITVRQAISTYGVSSASRPSWSGQHMTWVPQTTWLGIRGLVRKPGRLLLTLLALTLSGAMFLAVQTTTTSIDGTMQEVFGTYDGDIFLNVQTTSYAKLLPLLQSESNIQRIERTNGDLIRVSGGQANLVGLQADTQIYHVKLLEGRWLSQSDKQALVITDNFAQKAHVKVGDMLAISDGVNQAKWRIVGEVHDINQGLGMLGTVFTRVEDVNALRGLPTDLTTGVMIRTQDRSEVAVNRLAGHIDEHLGNAGLAPNILTQQQNIRMDQAQFQIIYGLFYAVAVIVALVGILGLFNTLSTSVLERRREIGILRSMGATSWHVGGIFWLEALTLALISWGIGVIIGVPCAYGFVTFISGVLIPIGFTFQPFSFLVMLIVILIIATLASFTPVMHASRMKIVETLRYE